MSRGRAATGAEGFDKAGEIKKKGAETDQGDVGDGMRAPHLQLLHLAGPAAAFLAVDAADGQRQDLLLQLRVRVDLESQREIKKKG